MMWPTKLGFRTGRPGSKFSGSIRGVDGTTGRIAILVGLRLMGQGREMHEAEHGDPNHNDQDHREDQYLAAPPRPGGMSKAGEESRTDRVSPIRAVRRLRLAHHPPSFTASSLERVITRSADTCGHAGSDAPMGGSWGQ
jgi:hypothetical protein